MGELAADIKRLAEAERACPGCGLQCDCPPGTDYHCQSHNTCGGTGRIVPFAALRVPCENLAFHIVKHQKASDYPCCEGRDWIPEPDVEKAEYATLLALSRYDLKRAQGVLADIRATGAKGLPIRAALAWLEEAI